MVFDAAAITDLAAITIINEQSKWILSDETC
jgi:hypothetical protein